MTDAFKINGKLTDRATWDRLKQIAEKTSPSTEKLFGDNALSTEEISTFLDADKNQQPQMQDLIQLHAQLGSPLFSDLKGILGRHGYNIYEKVNDLTQYDEFGFKLAVWDKAGNLVVENYEVPQEFWNDRDFVLKKVKTNGLSLQCAAPVLRADRELVLQAVRENGFALQYADPQLQSDKEIALAAIRNERGAARYIRGDIAEDPDILIEVDDFDVPRKFWNDRDFVLKRVRADGLSLQYATPILRADRELVLQAVRENGLALGYADPQLQSDKTIALAAVQENGFALEHADPKLRSDKVVALAAIRNVAGAAMYIGEDIAKDPDILIEKVKQDNSWLSGIELSRNPIVQHNRSLLVRIILNDHNLIGLLEARMKPEVWKDVRGALRRKGILFPQRAIRSPLSFRRWIQRKLSHFPERFRSFETIYSLWRNKQQLKSKKDPRPTALLIYNQSDPTRAYISNPIADRLTDSGRFNVLYFETSNDKNALRILKRVTQYSHRPIHTLVFAGHGTRYSLKLGDSRSMQRDPEKPPTHREEPFYVDISDFGDKGEFPRLRKYLEPGGQVFLYSCGSGAADLEHSKDLAGALGSVLPRSIRIYALPATSSSGDFDLGVTDDLQLRLGGPFFYLEPRTGSLE